MIVNRKRNFARERPKRKMKVGISIRQRSVADEEIIAGALRQFRPVFEQLYHQEKKALMGLLIKQIRLKHIETESFARNQLGSKVRNKLNSIEFDFSSDRFLLGDSRTGPLEFVKNSKWRPVKDSNLCFMDEIHAS